MSLVQAYITKNFILAGGDTRAILGDGSLHENFRKIFKLNPTTIIGIAGTIEGNAILFRDYLYNNKVANICEKLSYSDIERDLLSRLYFESNIKKYGVDSFICGWDGNHMVGTLLFGKFSKWSLS